MGKGIGGEGNNIYTEKIKPYCQKRNCKLRRYCRLQENRTLSSLFPDRFKSGLIVHSNCAIVTICCFLGIEQVRVSGESSSEKRQGYQQSSDLVGKNCVV